MPKQERCVVRWQHGTYTGTETVYVDPDDDDDVAVARARREMRRRFGPPLAMAYESFRVVERRPAD